MDTYSFLLQKIPKDELERKIAEKVESMNGFLTREAAIRIIANEFGVKNEEQVKLSNIIEGMNRIFVIAKLEQILKLQEFANGKKMRKVVISDETGERELKLWNQDIDLLNNLHSGDLIEIKGAYCKNNELSLGYDGTIKVVQSASFANLSALSDLENLKINAIGYVESIDGIKEYERNGQKRKMFLFSISDGTKSVRAIIWNDSDRGNVLFIGCEVKIENAIVRNGELHINSFSRFFVKKIRKGIKGKIENMKIVNGKLILEINGNKYEFVREDALKILNVQVADDIEIETVLELKKNEFLGKEVFIENENGKIGKIIVKN